MLDSRRDENRTIQRSRFHPLAAGSVEALTSACSHFEEPLAAQRAAIWGGAITESSVIF